MTTIEKINYYLAKLQMSGADLERKLGLSKSVYSQWNTGRTKPSRKRLAQIAEVLQVTVDDLLPDDEEKEGGGKSPTDDEIKFALFGSEDVSDELFAEVRRYAKYALEQEKFKKFKQGG